MTDAYHETTYFENLSIGDAGPEVVIRDVGLHDFVRYAGASGDFNPIHYDHEYAHEAGNETIFGQGMFTASVLSHMVSDWVGRGAVLGFTTRFSERITPKDDLHAKGKIVARDENTSTVEGNVRVENQDGITVATGSFRAKLPRMDD